MHYGPEVALDRSEIVVSKQDIHPHAADQAVLSKAPHENVISRPAKDLVGAAAAADPIARPAGRRNRRIVERVHVRLVFSVELIVARAAVDLVLAMPDNAAPALELELTRLCGWIGA